MANDSGRLRSAGLRPEPEEVSALRAAVAIAQFSAEPWRWVGEQLVGGNFTIARSVQWWNAKDGDKHLIASAPRLYRELEAAGAIFRAYEALHLEKGTEDGVAKAKRNAAFADTIESVLAEARGDTPNVSGLSHTGVDRG